MRKKVMELVDDLGFRIITKSPVYGDASVRIHAESEDRLIWATVTRTNLEVRIADRVYGSEIATFYFWEGKDPDLRFRKYSLEMLEIAQRFAEVAGFELWPSKELDLFEAMD